MVGKLFELGRIGSQRGVDPNTLGRGSRRFLDRQRYAVQVALIDGGITRATPIKVNVTGRVFDGHHGIRAAIDKDVAVDIEVSPGGEQPAGPPAVRDIPFEQ